MNSKKRSSAESIDTEAEKSGSNRKSMRAKRKVQNVFNKVTKKHAKEEIDSLLTFDPAGSSKQMCTLENLEDPYGTLGISLPAMSEYDEPFFDFQLLLDNSLKCISDPTFDSLEKDRLVDMQELVFKVLILGRELATNAEKKKKKKQ